MQTRRPDTLLVVSSYWPTVENSISGIFVTQQLAALLEVSDLKIVVLLPRTSWDRKIPLEPRVLGIDDCRCKLAGVSGLRLPERLSSSSAAMSLNARFVGRSIARHLAGATTLTSTVGCIVHGLRYAGLGLPHFLSDCAQVPTALVLHGRDPRLCGGRLRDGDLRVLSPAFRRADSVVVVGRTLVEHAESLGSPSQKIHVVPNGTVLPTHAYHERPIRQGASLVVLSVSNLTEIKGIDDNLRALAAIMARRPDLRWQYRVVGDGPERTRLEVLAADLGISNNVVFLGRLPYEATMHEMEKADVFSLPSWQEAFGVVYLEAMARRLPVVGCLGNGPADFVIDGVNGILVPPRSHESLSDALESLLRDAYLRHELGAEAQLTAEKFTWHRNAHTMLKLLELSNHVAE